MESREDRAFRDLRGGYIGLALGMVVMVAGGVVGHATGVVSERAKILLMLAGLVALFLPIQIEVGRPQLAARMPARYMLLAITLSEGAAAVLLSDLVTLELRIVVVLATVAASYLVASRGATPDGGPR